MTSSCAYCGSALGTPVLDLNVAPATNDLLYDYQVFGDSSFTYYPLRLYYCELCHLVQTDRYMQPEALFSAEYPYYSSQSKSNVSHAKEFVDHVLTLFTHLNLKDSTVYEIGCNDGYMLQHFPKKMRVFGFEPSLGPATAAEQKGFRVFSKFFDARLARDFSGQADLICGINVLAHMPGINNVMRGLRIMLKSHGIAVFEFPHVLNTIQENQFDTIYHEHYFYFSATALRRICKANGLDLFHVEETPQHGGSLRIYLQRADGPHRKRSSVDHLIDKEQKAGITRRDFYLDFRNRVITLKHQLIVSVMERILNGKKVVAYGAAAKGVTLLNYCGFTADTIPYVVDISQHKQGMYIPGCHIPIVKEWNIKNDKPDCVLILPWNIKGEIMAQLSYIHDWGGEFIVAIPNTEVWR